MSNSVTLTEDANPFRKLRKQHLMADPADQTTHASTRTHRLSISLDRLPCQSDTRAHLHPGRSLSRQNHRLSHDPRPTRWPHCTRDVAAPFPARPRHSQHHAAAESAPLGRPSDQLPSPPACRRLCEISHGGLVVSLPTSPLQRRPRLPPAWVPAQGFRFFLSVGFSKTCLTPPAWTLKNFAFCAVSMAQAESNDVVSCSTRWVYLVRPLRPKFLTCGKGEH